jgi:hypothetical protein
LKAGNKALLPGIASSSMLAAEGEPFGKAFYVSLDTASYKQTKRDGRVKLKALVFPRHDRDCAETAIGRLPAKEYPESILRSFMGKDPPSALFRKIVRMAAAERLPFLEMRFADGADAADKLYIISIADEMRETRNGI